VTGYVTIRGLSKKLGLASSNGQSSSELALVSGNGFPSCKKLGFRPIPSSVLV